MKLHDAAAEVPFEARIDARFPYNDHAEARALISEACNISLNTIFCVLDEICRAPERYAVTQQRQLELVAEWSNAFEHELKAPLICCAETLIRGRALPWQDAVAVMEKVSSFEAQRAALSVAYFSGDSDSREGDAALDFVRRRVSDAWDKMGV